MLLLGYFPQLGGGPREGVEQMTGSEALKLAWRAPIDFTSGPCQVACEVDLEGPLAWDRLRDRRTFWCGTALADAQVFRALKQVTGWEVLPRV